MIENTCEKLHLGEVFYYLMLLCFMGAKAVGLGEGQWPFSVAIILGILLFFSKLLTSNFSVLEWIITGLLILLSGVVYFRNGHIEVLIGVAFVVGMKDIPLKRALKVALAIWGCFFALTVLRALFGIYPGVINTQTKVGMDFGVIRYSLGFTHPNVLHITYFVITALILASTNFKGKKLVWLLGGLLVGNVYIFLYSVSYTGFIVTALLIIMFALCVRSKKAMCIESVVIIVLSVGFILVPLWGQSLLPSEIANFINRIINNRLALIGKTFSQYPPSLFGNTTSIEAVGLNLDCSFAYSLYYHGIIAFVLFALSYLISMVTYAKRRDRVTLYCLFVILLSGVTEQYIGNLSCKNISLLFIGAAIFNELLPVFACKMHFGRRWAIIADRTNILLSGYRLYKSRIRHYFEGTPYHKCMFPAIVVGLVTCLVFNAFWMPPEKVYQVIKSVEEAESTPITYDASMYNGLELDRSIVIGELSDGVMISEIGWINLETEFYRGIASSFFWGTIIGFAILAFLFNTRKLNTVCIEPPIAVSDNDEPEALPYCTILGTKIAVTNMQDMVGYLKKYHRHLSGKYICVSNVHTTVTSYRDEEYRNIQNSAVFALPDGKPLSYVSRRRGFIQADRVAGPDLMTEIFKISAQNGYRHFFFGSTEDTLEKLKESLEAKYPGISIAGMLSPKFYKHVEDIPAEENDEYLRLINESEADFVWVGLGAPKQEQWMAMNQGRVKGVMLGVGAGFDFHAGTIKRAPKLLQGLYLEWFYRLLQDPKRLFKRYFSTNASFVIETIKEGRRLKRNKAEGDKKRLLIYAHYYAPDVASTGQILTELAEGLRDSLDVTVIAVVPSYNGHIEDKYKKFRYYQQNVKGVRVVRVRVPEFTKTNKLSRAWNIWEYYVRARKVTKKVGYQDYVLSISQPPILGGMLGRYGKRKKHAKFIYNIQDFNPEQIKSVGYSKNPILLWCLQRIDNKSCRKSDLIITVGRDLGQTIEKRFAGTKVPKYTVINNWIDETMIYPVESSNSRVVEFKKKYGLENKYVFMYSGNLGLYYDLDALFEVIASLPSEMKSRDGREVVFAFVGDGGKKSELEEYVKKNKLKNVVFIPYQDKEDLVYSLNSGDVHICTNAKGIKGVSCPSKYYGIAAAGKPVLASLEEDTEIRILIENTKSGLVSAPGDNDTLKDNIMKFVETIDAEDAGNMGMRARNNLLGELTKNKSIARYEEEILNL